jgi:hypothetical protein
VLTSSSAFIRANRASSICGLAACLLLPSLGVVHKYLGLAGVVCYLPLGLCGIVVFRHVIAAKAASLSHKTLIIFSLSTLLAILVLFLVLYPRAQRGDYGGGSDADDALDLAATEMVHGRYPYHPRTYLDNAISPLPGAVILALPFVLLGGSAYQNIFWLAVFLYLAGRQTKSAGLALALFWAVLCLSPLVLQNLVTGTDYLSNAIYVPAFMYWMIQSITREKSSTLEKATAAALLGIGLSSRANFIACLPLAFSALVQNAGWRPAIKYTLLTVATFGAVTIPFWLYAPEAFTPLTQQIKKASEFDFVVRHAGLFISGISALLAGALSLRRMDRGQITLFRSCALVQAVPVLAVVTLSSFASGKLNLIYTGYGMFSLFFGALGFWKTSSAEETSSNSL